MNVFLLLLALQVFIFLPRGFCTLCYNTAFLGAFLASSFCIQFHVGPLAVHKWDSVLCDTPPCLLSFPRKRWGVDVRAANGTRAAHLVADPVSREQKKRGRSIEGRLKIFPLSDNTLLACLLLERWKLKLDLGQPSIWGSSVSLDFWILFCFSLSSIQFKLLLLSVSTCWISLLF